MEFWVKKLKWKTKNLKRNDNRNNFAFISYNKHENAFKNDKTKQWKAEFVE